MHFKVIVNWQLEILSWFILKVKRSSGCLFVVIDENNCLETLNGLGTFVSNLQAKAQIAKCRYGGVLLKQGGVSLQHFHHRKEAGDQIWLRVSHSSDLVPVFCGRTPSCRNKHVGLQPFTDL